MLTPDAAFEVLRAHNEKVLRLENTKLFARYKEDIPNVIAKFDEFVSCKPLGEGSFEIIGKITSWVSEFEQEEIEAFVLTYRMLTQNNDRLSIANIAKIYEADWMESEPKELFKLARQELNKYLDEQGTTFIIEDRNLSMRYLLDMVIYGGLAHSNPKHQEAFDALNSAPGLSGFMWVEFIAALKEMMRYLSYFKALNEVVIHNYSIGPTVVG